MDAELLIHGPRHAFYGRQEEILYCQLFDNSQIKDEVRFVVEVRRGEGGRLYTYYTYCRYANVRDVDGRSGAYIGLTVRLDAYYSNLQNLFFVLDSAFTSKVVGLLVKKLGNGYQYLVDDFRNSKQTIVNNVERNVGTMLASVISNDEIYPIDSSFNIGGREIVKGLNDLQFAEARLNDIKSSGKLIFSSSKDSEFVERLKRDFDVRSRSILAEKSKEIDDIRTSYDALNNEKNGLREEVDSLKNQKSALEADAVSNKEKIEELNSKVAALSSEQEKVIKLQKDLDSLRKENLASQKKIEQAKNEIKELKEKLKSRSNGSRTVESQPVHVVDSISSRWSFSELGEGLKIGIFAFFLVAVVCCAVLSIKYFVLDEKNCDIVAEQNDGQVENSGDNKPKCLSLPNGLTNRIFPDCSTTEALCGKLNGSAISNEDDSTLSLRFVLTDPKIDVRPFTWMVIDSNGKELLCAKTDSTILECSPDVAEKLRVQVFARDTLIVMKSFNF